ncbi:MAG: nicotinamidase [Candidatus Nealsonbacteria bacterium]|nr:nicotinamidase [Candidatus Nealsonbacteria bacterium]
MADKKISALIVVDVQKCFCPGGALPVPHGDDVVPVINRIENAFDIIIFTKEGHPENHCSFKEYGGIWPKHGVKNTDGAKFHPELSLPSKIRVMMIEKGTDPNKEAYSGFDGTDLEKLLKENGVKRVYVCGLATDYCVKETALDAKKVGFETYVIIDACRGVNAKHGDVARAIKEMKKAGIQIIISREV